MADIQSKPASSNRILSSIASNPYSSAKSAPLSMPNVSVNLGVGAPGYGGLNTYGSNPNAGGTLATPVYAAEKVPDIYGSATKVAGTQSQNIQTPNTVTNKTTTQQTTNQIPSNLAKSAGPNDLVSALVSKGYNLQDALNAANGPDADKLRAEYLKPASDKPSDEDISGKYKEKTGLDIDPNLLDQIKNDNSGRSLDDLLNEIESNQRGAAEEEYNAVMDVLGKQKEELRGTSEYQKEKLRKQLAMDIEELGVNKAKDVGSIETQQQRFEQQNEANKDQIAANWRDLSLKTQAIARARGITNSDFAGQIESKQAMELNKGLRTLATNAQNVFADFFKALTDTNDYYTRADSKLKFDAQSASDDIDQWLESSVTAIQSQERVALGTKLAQVKQAVAEASKIKLNIAQQAETRRQNLEDWLLQTKVNFDNSLKLAAAGKIQSASDKITEQTKYFNMIKSGLQSGALSIKPSGTGASIVGGFPLLTGKDEFTSIPTTTEAYNAYQAGLRQTDPLKQLTSNLIGGLGFNPNEQQY